VWVFLRADKHEQVLVALNANDQMAEVALPDELSEQGAGAWKLVFGSSSEKATFPNIAIAGTSGRVWVRPTLTK
jgi:hypothetical protein